MQSVGVQIVIPASGVPCEISGALILPTVQKRRDAGPNGERRSREVAVGHWEQIRRENSSRGPSRRVLGILFAVGGALLLWLLALSVVVCAR